MHEQFSWSMLGVIAFVIVAVAACSDPSEEPSGTPDTSGTSNSASNGTTGPTSNGTTSETSNGTTSETSNGTTGTTESGLQVADGAARSCEVMLRDAGHSLKAVRFADTVEGRSMRRGANLAVSFFVKTDAAIPSGAVSFEAAQPTDGVEIVTSRCFDQPGALIAAPGVGLTF
ncbi:MAG: hypothetical protein CMH57_06415 [Myxococcales bacterium]|nr:hypothetical protein [Myxococcales bacterium]